MTYPMGYGGKDMEFIPLTFMPDNDIVNQPRIHRTRTNLYGGRAKGEKTMKNEAIQRIWLFA